jgi:hypothetical protein
MTYLEEIAKYSHKDVAELEKMSQRELVDNVILPLWVKKTGQDERGWRVPDSFMDFMARFGNYCYSLDSYTGAVLYEIALQRVSCGAVLHKHRKVKVDEFLPSEYAKYSTIHDQRGLMSAGCWSFLRDQMKFMLYFEPTKEHATAILFGVLDNVDRRGNLLNGYMFNSEQYGVPDARDMWAWAVKNAVTWDLWPWDSEVMKNEKCHIPPQVAAEHFSQPQLWRHYLWYWAGRWPKMSDEEKDKFFNAIGVSGWWQKRIVKKEIARQAKEMSV